MDELIEALADAEHASWSRWMDHLFSKCTQHADGSVTIPSWAVERWRRLAATTYANLEESEKASDRNEVQHILPLITAYAEQYHRSRNKG